MTSVFPSNLILTICYKPRFLDKQTSSSTIMQYYVMGVFMKIDFEILSSAIMLIASICAISEASVFKCSSDHQLKTLLEDTFFCSVIFDLMMITCTLVVMFGQRLHIDPDIIEFSRQSFNSAIHVFVEL